jgi:hypothetical protein
MWKKEKSNVLDIKGVGLGGGFSARENSPQGPNFCKKNVKFSLYFFFEFYRVFSVG